MHSVTCIPVCLPQRGTLSSSEAGAVPFSLSYSVLSPVTNPAYLQNALKEQEHLYLLLTVASMTVSTWQPSTCASAERIHMGAGSQCLSPDICGPELSTKGKDNKSDKERCGTAGWQSALETSIRFLQLGIVIPVDCSISNSSWVFTSSRHDMLGLLDHDTQ